MFRKLKNTHVTLESEFVSDLRRIVVRKLAEDSFGVNALAKEARLSRSQLHRKLKMLTGKSASCFIREIRLHRATQLLRDNNSTMAEIAYKVGFSSPSYFNKCFHDYFGYSPGEYKKHAKASAFLKKTKITTRGSILNYLILLTLVLLIAFILIVLYFYLQKH
nr:AraC family transcriptional regulator [uncultured Draconibacterium sp.]